MLILVSAGNIGQGITILLAEKRWSVPLDVQIRAACGAVQKSRTEQLTGYDGRQFEHLHSRRSMLRT